MKKISKIFLLVVFVPVVSFANGSQTEGRASGGSASVSQEMANVSKYISGSTEAQENTSKAQLVDFDQQVATGDNAAVSKEMSDVSKYISDAGIKEKPKETAEVSHESYVQSMYAEQSAALSSLYEKKSYVPRLYLGGYVGSSLVGSADLLIPAYLTGDRTFVIYGQGRYGLDFDAESFEGDTWTGSGGLLYRQIINDKVLGVYILGDYSQSSSSHNYWVIGPGIESLGKVWDFHLNGYIPIGSKYWKNEAWAQEYGMYEYTSFEEGTNNVYDHRIAYYEETGVGADFEVGRNLAKIGNGLLKGYVQSYYYNMDHNSDLFGMGVKITYQPSSYVTFSANDTYDKDQHNVFMLGAQVRINDLFSKEGRSKKINEKDLSARLLDPIDRNYAAISKGNTSPIPKSEPVDLGQGLFTNNGVFFSDNGSGYVSQNADQYPKGTYGNPYTEEGDITTYGMQYIFDDIRNDFTGQVYMYFAPGSYTAYTTTETGYDAVFLDYGMTIYGRDYWYTTPTTGTQRATFVGSLSLAGNNTLDSIMMQNYVSAIGVENNLDEVAGGEFDVGISTVSGATNINLNNVEVGALNNDQGYATGILMDNSVMTITNSNIYGYQNGAATANGEVNATGIEMINGGMLTVANSNVYGEAIETSGLYSESGNGYGIHADGLAETIIVSDSYIYGSGAIFGGSAMGYIYASGNGYGILVGENYVNASADGADFSIHNNSVTVQSATVVGKGESNLNAATIESSGNGFGALIGYNKLIRVGDGDYNTSYASVSYNTLTIEDGSLIQGEGTVNNTGTSSSDTASGNGFGVLVGSNYSHLYNHLGDYEISYNSVDNNIIKIYDSSLIGHGKIASGVNESYSGNGYGLLIGSNYLWIRNGRDSDYNYNSIYAQVEKNMLDINTSSLSGYGTADNVSGTASYVGNGTGLLVGFGTMEINANWDYDNIYIYNRGNTLTITNSLIYGESDGSTIGNGFGIVIGNENVYSAYSLTGAMADASVNSNIITIIGGKIGAKGSFGGNSEGILIGYSSGDIRSGLNYYGSYDNVLTVKDAVITAEANGLGTSYGINLKGQSSTTINNTIDVTGSDFHITTGGASGWGIFMQNGSGTLNIDAATANDFFGTGVSGGGKVCFSDGTCVLW